ncbi:MAG: OmpA family protein [Chitinophagaceae bacterium]|nr:OmpA family protein [Chitinophagaceae bacterium]
MKPGILVIVLCWSLVAASQQPLTVYFDFNRSDLTPAARMRLDSFAQAYQAGQTGITLDGHCDAIGSDGYNNQLSLRRVKEVKTYLLSKGLASSVIASEKGYGRRVPVNSNSTEAERDLNRRVEISFTQSMSKSNPGKNDNRSLQEKIADSTTVSGTQIVLKNINFYGGMHRLLPESLPSLQELLATMKANPTLEIEIQGHICCQPHTGDGLDSETRIYNLSEARAWAVRNHLLSNGIEAERVSYRGFGHSQPIHPYPEQSEDERMENRRVEIKIIKK